MTLDNWQCAFASVPPIAVNNLRMSAVKGLLQLTSCLCQPSIRSPHHVLKTFQPFSVKVTGSAQSDRLWTRSIASGQENPAQVDLS